MDDLGQQLSIFSIAVIFVIFLVGVFNGRSWFEMFVIGVAMAVAAIPEGLPIVTTVTLAMGVMRMAARKAIVKKLPSVETLGCTNIICCDKTGTLTMNQMTVKKIFTLQNQNIINVEGTSDFQGTFERNQKRIDVKDEKDVVKLLEIASLCNNAHVENQNVLGEPTEIALVHANMKAGLSNQKMEWTRIHEIPFSSATKWMAVQCENMETPETFYFVKGAVEAVLPKCLTYFNEGKEVKMASKELEIIENVSNSMAGQAMRVLAFAYGKKLDALTFCGFVGMIDPPRPGIKENIKTLTQCGVRTIMITGDAKLTAMSIAQDLGILTEQYPMAMAPIDIQDSGFLSNIEKTNVFYRMTPKHKKDIVEALQKSGNIVAMTGDGVNDAVAVKLADIGIAMGSGTDVCKEASKMVLLDDNFSTIMAAIEEGKSIFNGIKNFLRFQLSTSISALALIAITNVLGYGPPLNPMQILWINVIMDGPPAQTLGVEPSTKDTMKQPPRNPKDSVITRKLLTSVLLNSIIMIAGSLYVFLTEAKSVQMTTRETTMTFCVFVFFQMFNALNCRSDTKSIFSIGLFTNTAFLFAVGGCFLGQLSLIYIPFMRFIFETEYLSLFDLLLTIGIGSSVFVFEEILKFLKQYK
jgi:P-type Ca2+ transporter type 2C